MPMNRPTEDFTQAIPRTGDRTLSGRTLIDLIHARARSQPGAEALAGDGVGRTWAQLTTQTAGVAANLRGLGVGHGDRVAILGTNSLAWIETLLGIHQAGAVAVPINHRLKPAELDRMLADAGVVALATDPEFAAGTSFDGPLLPLSRNEHSLTDAASRPCAGPPPQPDDLAVIAYTSGTTGQPKGVMWSHRSLLASAAGNPFSAELGAGRRILLTTPLSAGGTVVMACNALAIGARLVVASFTPASVLDLLATEGIELVGLVPTMISMLVDAAPPGWRAPALRRVYYGAGAMTPGLFSRAQQLFGCEFQQGYGMTESCICGTRLDPSDHTLDVPERLASAGRPMPGVAIKVVGDDGGEVPAGAPGEVLIRGPGNMLGYWRQEEESRRALADGWYWTRDVGRCDQDGYLYLLDRKDDVVKSGGLNVLPAEVERVLLTHPGVEEVAVIGLPDERWGQRVAAIVRKRAGVALHERDLLTLCRSELAGYQNPRTIIFTEAPLPRNALGKLSRQALRSLYRTQGVG